ncbi:MAG: hypothetical protein IJE97_16430 [Thermoguttaceae bacterium]|nr:hypothetical protein [Thermoguttaceae bacterium]
MAAIKTITTKIIMGRDGVFEIDDTKVPGIVSVSLTYQRELVDVTTRDDGGWTKKYPGVKSATAEVELFRIEGDATQDLFCSKRGAQKLRRARVSDFVEGELSRSFRRLGRFEYRRRPRERRRGDS